MSSLIELPNIGRVLDEKLNSVGITTPQQLRQVGAKESFLLLRAEDPFV